MELSLEHSSGSSLLYRSKTGRNTLRELLRFACAYMQASLHMLTYAYTLARCVVAGSLVMNKPPAMQISPRIPSATSKNLLCFINVGLPTTKLL